MAVSNNALQNEKMNLTLEKTVSCCDNARFPKHMYHSGIPCSMC